MGKESRDKHIHYIETTQRYVIILILLNGNSPAWWDTAVKGATIWATNPFPPNIKNFQISRQRKLKRHWKAREFDSPTFLAAD